MSKQGALTRCPVQSEGQVKTWKEMSMWRHSHPVKHRVKDRSRYGREQVSRRHSHPIKHRVKDRLRYERKQAIVGHSQPIKCRVKGSSRHKRKKQAGGTHILSSTEGRSG